MSSRNATKLYRGYTYTAKDAKEIANAYAELTEKQLKINANLSARNTIPEGDDHIPSGSQTEIDIFNAFNATEKNILGWMKGGKNQCKLEIDSDCIVEKIDLFSEKAIKRKLDNSYRSIASEDSEAREIAKDYLETSKELRLFKDRHKRHAAAKYPKIKLKPYAIVAFLFLGETLINGYVFKDLSGGILGGIFVAFFFAFINLLIALVTGIFGWKNLIYKDTIESVGRFLHNILGLLVTITGLVIAFAWNLGVAHYREVATSNTFDTLEGLKDTGRIAIQHFIDNPFGLEQLEAYALWGFGLVIFIFLAKDFYSGFDDPYPGYGDITRKQKDAEAAWYDFKVDKEEELKDELNKIKNDTYSENDGSPLGFNALIKEDKKKIDDANEKYKNLLLFKHDLQSSLEDSMNLANAKLGLFRESYLKIVGENGRRKHFDTWIKVSENAEKVFDVSNIKEKIDEIEENYEYNKTVYENAITIVDEHIAEYINRLHSKKINGDKDDGYFERLLKNMDKHHLHDEEIQEDE